ncbi:MAG TPA: hypothetical protein VM123_09740 [archaeon]|nr:hypothetical protein [archaeon]
MKRTASVFLVLYSLMAMLSAARADEMLASHKVYRGRDGGILAWYKPDVPGAAYAHAAKLAAGFIKTVSVEPNSGLKLYMVHADFNGPNQDENYYKGTSGTDWMPNPACVFAGFVQSLALDYRVFSGDNDYLGIVRECLDQMLENGTTPADWPWPNCPYASADPKSRIYQGATKWEDTRRGDGLHCLEPDKVSELGIGYLKFYEITEEKKYLQAAIDCADALARNVRYVLPDKEKFTTNFDSRSPWPFRVNARTGIVVDEYTSNVIEPVRLFDELIRIRQRIELDPGKVENYTKARNLAWEWLFAKNGPMKTYIWNGYFEDIPSDLKLQNRVQITPMETARYILKHPECDPNWETDIPALVHWVRSVFGTDKMEAIKEQTWCYFPMGSHTSRYASVCALYYEKTGDRWYKDQAFRFFNYASYMCEEGGYVWVGPEWETAWFSDGWGDYIKHFMEGLAAVPEWAPGDEDHLLKSTSVVQTISYEQHRIRYKTFDAGATEVLRMRKKPKSITVGSLLLKERMKQDTPGWTWEKLQNGGVLRIRHERGTEVVIEK